MIRKAWLFLAICTITAIVMLIFQGWRLSGLALLPLEMTIC